ncbi:DUF4199 domain-containing protein [Flavobacterium selenitireducens]|uniref:DUF4199 domain-containing protein n=1 Tax=Flavobacterium selenitireducens TaxID=2722704 RepID=UPI00168B8E09|nr:DUF4199 domain-containing protein [Flavobacterium selenitireducens]MBD3582789.1 DUF4199 domain-containing protein [Flavobacterium selenitireducens]
MDQAIKKNGTTYGIILGVIGILTTTLIYVFQLYTAWWVSLLSFVISIVMYCMMLSKTKKEMGGVYSFKDAFTTFFIAAVIAVLIGTIYNVVLYNFVDPGAKEVVKEESIKATVSILEKLGTPNSEINKAVEKLEGEDQFSIGALITNAAIITAISCILGLILALIFKSRPTYKE